MRGSQPPSPVALLLTDFINPFDYPRADELLAETTAILQPLADLLGRAREAEIPVIYVNDNFGRWRSSFAELIAHCEAGPGRDIVRALRPDDHAFFVLKPQRSGFYGTPLELLLQELETERLVLTGIVTEMCVLATASDAALRGYELCVPRDGTASFTADRRDRALRVLADSLGIASPAAAELLR